jgi:hypothetical protein
MNYRDMILTNILLALILTILLLDFCFKNSTILKKRFRKVEKVVKREKDYFSIRKK